MKKTTVKERIAKLEDREPFLQSELNMFSKSDRNFIRGIQVARGYTKPRAIRYFRDTYGDRNSIRAIGARLQALSDRGVVIYSSEELRERRRAVKIEQQTPKPGKKYRYEYAGQTDVPLSIKSRYQVDKKSGTARRYIDTETGENISRRERDKRLKAYKEGFGDL